MTRKTCLHWLITLLIPALIMLIPTSELFTPAMQSMCAVTMLGMLMLCFSLMDSAIVAFILMLGYLVIGIPQKVVFSAWLSDIPWLVLFSLLFVNIVSRTSLLDKMAYSALSRFGSSYMAIMMIITSLSIALRLILPSSMGFMLVLTFAYGLCMALDYKGRPAAGLLLMSLISYKDASFFIYSPDFIAILYEAGRTIAGLTPSYSEFFINNAVFVINLYLTAFGLALLCRPKSALPGKAFFAEKLSALGRTTVDEKKIIAVLVGLLVYIFASSYIGLPILWGFMLAPIILYLPGFNIGTANDIKTINYNSLLFIAGCMAIGSAATATNAGKALALGMLPVFESMSAPVFTFVCYVMMVLLNFFMTPLASMGAFAAPLTELAMQLNFNLHPIYLAVFNGVSQVLLPHETATYLICFSFGLFSLRDFMIVLGLKMIIQTLFLVTFGFGWWTLMGLF